jgi:hypothetical protein
VSSHKLLSSLLSLLLALLLSLVPLLLLASSLWHAFLLLLAYFSSWWFPVAGLAATVGVPGGVGVSAVPFEHAVAGILLLLAFLLLMVFLT